MSAPGTPGARGTGRAEVVVLDVEGTTGSAAHVREVLFPFARKRLADFLAHDAEDALVRAVVEAVRRETGRPGLDREGALEALTRWADEDAKVAPLKTVQGRIWAEGYARGELHGHVYPEVPGVLRRWRADGIRIFSYSSGSVTAQRDWYRHTEHGDLTPLFRGMFDLENVGPKDRSASYHALLARFGPLSVPPVLLSDAGAELDAAAGAGWRTIGVRRPGDPRGRVVPGHPTVPDLDRARLQGPGPRGAPGGSPGEAVGSVDGPTGEETRVEAGDAP
ncbi:acireductone synthase [Streptomyces calidiresistens]|uniref:Acireductone synthase n=1 Tax=Streptomyces calidiresistens TaxID=1485586 RepID=A0A7W3XYK9_9ACTN|nr:acireductone synthase [Streptomyces calidiresistens]MBB0232088.1 acireductone synthase [Streptomyces calidiresistens]